MRKRSKHKDKCAAKLKALRRAERESDLQAQKKSFFEDFDNHLKESGVKLKYDHEEAWRAQKRLQNKFQRHTIMTALVAAMYWLSTEMHWAEVRLNRYVWRVKNCIDILEERNLNKLCEDLKFDAGIDLREMCRGWKTANDYAGCIMANAAYGLTAVLWPLYEYYGWRKKRMRAAAEGMCAIMREAISAESGVQPYISRIENKTGIRIELDGQTRVVR